MLEYYRFKKIHELFIKGREKEAIEQLAELQKRYIALCDNNTNLKMQVQEFEDILYLSRNLIFDQQFYWLITGRIKQGPFCPTCYDLDGILIRLSGEKNLRQCSLCNSQFVVKNEENALVQNSSTNHESCSAYVPQQAQQQKRSAKILPFVR